MSNYPLRLCFIFDKKPARHINEFKCAWWNFDGCGLVITSAVRAGVDVCDDVLLYYKCKMTAKLPAHPAHTHFKHTHAQTNKSTHQQLLLRKLCGDRKVLCTQCADKPIDSCVSLKPSMPLDFNSALALTNMGLIKTSDIVFRAETMRLFSYRISSNCII